MHRFQLARCMAWTLNWYDNRIITVTNQLSAFHNIIDYDNRLIVPAVIIICIMILYWPANLIVR